MPETIKLSPNDLDELWVYFAGKVTKNGWREQIFSREGVGYWDHYDITSRDEALAIAQKPFTDRSICKIKDYRPTNEDTPRKNVVVRYLGPVLYSCDHGCFHGHEGDHGMGNNTACGGYDWQDKNLVFDSCLNGIKHADLVFCWLDSERAYGTISELSLAASLDKDIIVSWYEGIDHGFIKDIWFSLTKAVCIGGFRTAKRAWVEALKRIKITY